ncbi:hypothetical protein TSOC_007217 [Tetrabaena socialis]|uniref:Myb-like domain-containing protein n=1 Tax=Tetrabaena socialis TaxID=47790 RepID=A0A2J8A1P0_9CHLO|nr:hypothetical protein TSOC_007217 [Tetrabaena socialis]|eukprot:PNH06432.1 hypothetical protein TSOC_007217 [Tetrabaena socialis]
MEAEPSTSGGPQADRLEFVREMRRRFSPKAMLKDDGSIDQDFFKPRRVVLVQAGAPGGPRTKWGAPEREALLKGLEEHGVGKWREIARDFLPGDQWEETQLRTRAARLLGTQSLARYVGWKGSAAEVEEVYERNKAIGAATGCWKGGILVEDDDGTLKKFMEQQQHQQQQPGRMEEQQQQQPGRMEQQQDPGAQPGSMESEEQEL